LKPTQPDSRAFLLDMLDNLETLKAELADNDAVTNEVAGAAYIANFADGIFKSADDEDRDGKASKYVFARMQ
jgi:vacuolar protein sorting-associated protein VTA1